MTVDSPVVFDAEPLLAYLGDEPGSGTVEDVLEDVRADRTAAYISYATLTEVTYIAERRLDAATVRDYVETVQEYGLEAVGIRDVWQRAAHIKNDHDVSFGDAFVVATAIDREATLFVGADGDFDTVSEVPVERFRTEPA